MAVSINTKHAGSKIYTFFKSFCKSVDLFATITYKITYLSFITLHVHDIHTLFYCLEGCLHLKGVYPCASGGILTFVCTDIACPKKTVLRTSDSCD